MLPCDKPEKQKKIYTIPKVSKKRAAAISSGEFKPKPKKPIKPKAGYKIKPRSDKRAKQEKEYSKLSAQYKKEHPVCERCRSKTTTDIHHKAGRVGKLLTDITNFIALCRWCHKWAEENPAAAKEEGISLSRLSN